MAEVQEYINREAADIEARKLGLMDSAKALAEKGYEIPEYVLAGLTQDQKDALQLTRSGIGAYKPFLTQAEQAMQQGLGTTWSNRRSPNSSTIRCLHESFSTVCY